MTDNSRAIINTIGLFLMIVIALQAMTLRQITLQKQTIEATTVAKITNAERIDSYNAGFRAGSMDIVAQLVECEGVKDETVLQYYYTASDTLARLGELDTEAYPCTE